MASNPAQRTRHTRLLRKDATSSCVSGNVVEQMKIARGLDPSMIRLHQKALRYQESVSIITYRSNDGRCSSNYLSFTDQYRGLKIR